MGHDDESLDDTDEVDEETAVAEMLEEADTDGDGKLSFREFILEDADVGDPSASSLLEGETESVLTEEDKEMLRDQFDKADTDGDGFIDKKELPGLLQVLEEDEDTLDEEDEDSPLEDEADAEVQA